MLDELGQKQSKHTSNNCYYKPAVSLARDAENDDDVSMILWQNRNSLRIFVTEALPKAKFWVISSITGVSRKNIWECGGWSFSRKIQGSQLWLL